MRESRPRQETAQCEACGKSFSFALQPKQNKRPKYCGAACRHQHMGDASRRGEMRPCAVCGKDVYKTRHQLNRATAFFCSADHATVYQGRGKMTYTCKTCDTLFRKSASFATYGPIKYCSPACRYADPEERQRLLELNRRQSQGYQTSCEKRGYALLDRLSVVFVPQHLVADKFCVDAYLPSHLAVIQFDGDYWHGNPAKYTALDHRQKKRVDFDRSQDAYMATMGLSILRLWDSDLKERPADVEARARRFLGLPLA